MVDRLLTPLLALLVALPMATRGPCCCLSEATAETVDGCCQASQGCCEVSPELPPCCRQAAEACCSIEADSKCGENPLERCGCTGCPTNQIINPIQLAASAPRVPTADELPPAIAAVSCLTPVEAPSLSGSDHGLAPVSHPPPDRQALLCVWTI
ncbi:hypothetical protein MalM25_24580 [Planctomycetes bacterium MalM25]|nr:hypothetical protein MalM25_24580 [Planctomycetes bacterium MalM25]